MTGRVTGRALHRQGSQRCSSRTDFSQPLCPEPAWVCPAAWREKRGTHGLLRGAENADFRQRQMGAFFAHCHGTAAKAPGLSGGVRAGKQQPCPIPLAKRSARPRHGRKRPDARAPGRGFWAMAPATDPRQAPATGGYPYPVTPKPKPAFANTTPATGPGGPKAQRPSVLIGSDNLPTPTHPWFALAQKSPILNAYLNSTCLSLTQNPHKRFAINWIHNAARRQRFQRVLACLMFQVFHEAQDGPAAALLFTAAGSSCRVSPNRVTTR